MSNLLERMVQRTRAPLPGIEPLQRPHYAPQRMSGPRSQADYTDSVDSQLEESGFSQPESQPADFHSALLPQTEGRRDVPAPRTAPTGDRSALQIPVESMPQPDLLPAGEPGLEPFHRRRSQDQLLRGKADERRAPGKSEAESPSIPAPDTTSAGVPAQPLVPANFASTSRPTSTPRAANSIVADVNKPATAQSPMVRRAQSEIPAWRRPENKRSQPDQRVSGFDESSGNTIANVSISIGHIEIRAAQAVEPARRPAFRPQVSLSDFLNQGKRERR